MHADLVLTGGPVYTADRARRRLVPAGPAASGGAMPGDTAVPGDSAVAVAGGRIVAVTAAGDQRIRDLTGPASLDEALARIRSYTGSRPGQEWIAGAGWRMEWFPGGTPGRGLLDQVTGGRAAFLLNRDAHGAWASTRALELAGIDRRTPDPPDGRIEREAGGEPQGTLHEGAATLVGRHVPAVTFEDRLAGLLLAQAHLHARGITAWQDAIIGDYLGSASSLTCSAAGSRARRAGSGRTR